MYNLLLSSGCVLGDEISLEKLFETNGICIVHEVMTICFVVLLSGCVLGDILPCGGVPVCEDREGVTGLPVPGL